MDIAKMNEEQLKDLEQLMTLRKRKLQWIEEFKKTASDEMKFQPSKEHCVDVDFKSIDSMDYSTARSYKDIIDHQRKLLCLRNSMKSMAKAIKRINYDMNMLSGKLGGDFILAMHPGDLLKEKMDENNWCSDYVGEQCGVPGARITNLITHAEDIDEDMAKKLEGLTEIPVHVWMNLQRSYDEAYEEKGFFDQVF